MLLATGRAAITLQPDPLVAGMHVVLRLCAIIFGGVPHVDDAGVVGQGASTRLSPFDFAESCKSQRRFRYWQAGRQLIANHISMFVYSKRGAQHQVKKQSKNFSNLTVGQTMPRIGYYWHLHIRYLASK